MHFEPTKVNFLFDLLQNKYYKRLKSAKMLIFISLFQILDIRK
jgi:hypothetical protein